MLIIKDLSKSFRRKEVLHSVDLTLGNGIYGLLGEMEQGKLHCCAVLPGYITIIMEVFPLQIRRVIKKA